MKTLANALATTASASLVCWWVDMPLIEATAVSVVVSSAVTALWWIGHKLALRSHPPSDIRFMMSGACPVCQTQGTLEEVTSTAEGTLVRCTRQDCRERFDIRRSTTGPIVLRLGQGVE